MADRGRGPVASGLALRLTQALFARRELSAADLRDLVANLAEAKIDEAVYPLLPLLASTAGVLDPDHPLAGKLKGIQRLTWYQNQLLLGRFYRVHDRLVLAGIRTLLLGDIAAALTLYEDHSVRPIHEMSVMVDWSHAPAVMELLRLDGWKPKFGLAPVGRDLLPGQKFVSAETNCEFELRWHVLPACTLPDADAEFWSRARPVKFEGRSALALAPADQLLYLSVRLPGSTPAHSSLWTADALQVLQAAGIGFGWGRLPEQAASHQVLVLARILLTRLAEYFSVSVPGTTLRQLQDLPVSWWERLEARYRRKQADERLLGILPLLWFDFMRARGPQGTRAIAIGFGNYLEEYWQVDSRQELLGLMLRLSARRLSAMLSGIGWRVRDRESS